MENVRYSVIHAVKTVRLLSILAAISLLLLSQGDDTVRAMSIPIVGVTLHRTTFHCHGHLRPGQGSRGAGEGGQSLT